MKRVGMMGQEKGGGEEDTGAEVKAEEFLGWETWNGLELEREGRKGRGEI